MSFMKTSFLILISLLTLAGCNSGGGSSSLSISTAFVSAGPNYEYYLTGHNKTTGNSLGRVIGEKTSLTLENGSWDFTIVGWDKSAGDKFAGNAQCGKSTAELKGGSSSISISLNTDCSLSDYAAGDFHKTDKTFKNALFKFCEDISSVSSASSSCTVNGITNSFRVSVLPFDESLIEGFVPNLKAAKLQSMCYMLDSSRSQDTSMRLPVVSNAKFFVRLEAFTSDDCSSGGQVYDFKNGIRPMGDIKVFSQTLTTHIFVKQTYVTGTPNRLPEISNIYDFTLDLFATGMQTFTLSDLDEALDCSQVSISSSNPVVLPPITGKITISPTSGGTGMEAACNITIKPDKAGQTTVDLTVTDSHGGTYIRSFNVNVTTTFMPILSYVTGPHEFILGLPMVHAPTTVDNGFSGGTGSAVCTATNLPPGLVISSDLCEISGTPLQLGDFNVQISYVNDYGGKVLNVQTLKIKNP